MNKKKLNTKQVKRGLPEQMRLVRLQERALIFNGLCSDPFWIRVRCATRILFGRKFR